MKLIFFGTPEYVIPVLEALKSAEYETTAVVCQPPKEVGRKKVLTSSPVANWAKENGIKIFDGKPKEIVNQLKELDTPLAVLASYGRIVPQEIIDVFPKGILNLHPSLLPKFRGATPVEGALVSCETETGVTIMKLDAGMDHGEIVTQFTEKINESDTKVTLLKRLFEMGARQLIEILPDYLAGKVQLIEQDHERAIFTTLMDREMGFIPKKFIGATIKGETFNENWSIPFVKDLTLRPTPSALSRFISAVNPWPGAWTEIEVESAQGKVKKRLKILKAHIEDGKLIIDRVQLEGKNPVNWKQFREGYAEAAF